MRSVIRENEKLIFRPGATHIEDFIFVSMIGIVSLVGVGILTASWVFSIIALILYLLVVYFGSFRISPLRLTVEVSNLGVTLLEFKKPIFSIPANEIRSVGTMPPDVVSKRFKARGVFLSVAYVADSERLKKDTRIVLPFLPRKDVDNPEFLSGCWIQLGDFEVSEAQYIVKELNVYLNQSDSKG